LPERGADRDQVGRQREGAGSKQRVKHAPHRRIAQFPLDPLPHAHGVHLAGVGIDPVQLGQHPKQLHPPLPGHVASEQETGKRHHPVFPENGHHAGRASAFQPQAQFPENAVRRAAPIQGVPAQVEQGAFFADRDRASSELRRLFKHDNRFPGTRQVVRRDQTGNASPDDSHVHVSHQHHPSFVFQQV